MENEGKNKKTASQETGKENAHGLAASGLAGSRSSKESGGPKGPEPTRYGDWEIAGKCVDF